MTPQIPSVTRCPIHGQKRIELIQWRVRALDRIKRRMAGQIPGFPLSPSDAAKYVGLIDARCKRAGLMILSASARPVSDVSDTSDLVSVLSGASWGVIRKPSRPISLHEERMGHLNPLLLNSGERKYPTNPTYEGALPTEPTQGEV